MASFENLIKPLDEKELKMYRSHFKRSLKNAKKFDKLHPPATPNNSHYACHIFNMSYNAVCQRDEGLLDQLEQEGKAYLDDQVSFEHHIKYNRACLRIAAERFDEAIVLLKELFESGINLHRSHIILYLIEIYNHLEDYKAAAPWVHEYLAHYAIDNKDPKGYVSYSGMPLFLKILAMAEDYESVIKYGLECIALKRRGEQYVHFLVAQTYLNLKDLPNALKYYNYIFKRKVPYPEAYANLSVYYYLELRDIDTTLQYLFKAVRACGTQPDRKKFLSDLYHNFAFFVRGIGDLEKARSYRFALFEAMGKPVLISDLTTLFSKDKESMTAYRTWLDTKLGQAEQA